jgi:hypothetical protein
VPKKIQAGLTNPSDEEASLRDLLSMVSEMCGGEKILLLFFVVHPSQNMSLYLTQIIWLNY